jgi:hypothetical protein
MGVLGRDLEAAYVKFAAAVDKELSALNAQLRSRKLDALKRLTQEEWQKVQKT